MRIKTGTARYFNYIEGLSKRTDKDSRINLTKIQDYMRILRRYGKAAGEPYMKRLDGDIWELRPIRARIFFASWTGSDFILLHHFSFKKTQKTPKSEIDKAKRNLDDMRERSGLQ
ncbi:MAG: type II toxin-antitoxin system RelE/ParE family toxin [Defluviitaleaceae bacterium]|nr:type II toxin-antitoxin system RelE/ParE family toxin [Defluviitaleaceae bacterium]